MGRQIGGGGRNEAWEGDEEEETSMTEMKEECARWVVVENSSGVREETDTGLPMRVYLQRNDKEMKESLIRDVIRIAKKQESVNTGQIERS